MALTTAVLDAAASGAVGVDATLFAAIHSDATSGSQTSTARVAITWGAPASGVVSATNVPMAFAGTAAAAATHLGLWSAASGGTFRGAAALTGDQAFNASGDYSVDAITMTAADTTT